MTSVINLWLLEQLDACPEYAEMFLSRFPEGFELTVENVEEHFDFLSGCDWTLDEYNYGRWFFNALCIYDLYTEDSDEMPGYHPREFYNGELVRLFCPCTECVERKEAMDDETFTDFIRQNLEWVEEELSRYDNGGGTNG